MNWKRLDEIALSNISNLKPTDICAIAREYKAGAGYTAGDTNQLIYNFKKSVSHRGTYAWGHRNTAISRFANELMALLRQEDPKYLMAVPSSKAKNDPQYDNRFEDLFALLQSLDSKFKVVSPIEVIATVQSSHSGGSRLPQEIMRNYNWVGLTNPHPHKVFIIDDVISSGGHFRACSDFLKQNGFVGQIVGVFWARTIN